MIKEPEKIRYELEKAYYIATNERPGPVLIDIPDDVQRAEIEPEKLEKFIAKEQKKDFEILKKKIERTIELLEKSERPIIILGNGIKLSKTENLAKEFVEKLQIPIALTWAALDLFSHDYPLSVRDFGVTANRPGNFAVQNADLILAIGTRLDTHETGSDLKTFAREEILLYLQIHKHSEL